jgi:hypothetical protein
MESIMVTFPDDILPVDVEYNIMVGMKENAQILCNVVVIGHTDNNEIRYRITAGSAEDFYLIGMIASSIIRRHNEKIKP